MKKTKNRSQVSLSTKLEIESLNKEEIIPLDVLNIEILNLFMPEIESKTFYLEATFCNQLLICGTITSGNKLECNRKDILSGQMNYDPSDYTKMGFFADTPLTVTLRPNKIMQSSSMRMSSGKIYSSIDKLGSSSSFDDVYCCNLDISTVFTDTGKMIVTSRMEPVVVSSVLCAKSWKNLPLIAIKIKVIRCDENLQHHKILQNANIMKVNLVGCYNMKVPFDEEAVYTAATILPICNEQDCNHVVFNHGYKVPKIFNSTNFLSHWENLRGSEQDFTKGEEKFTCNLEEIYNPDNINLDYYINKFPKSHTTLWASFHKVFVAKSSENWLADLIRRYKWPFEIQMYRETGNYCFMACLDLYKLLYPGETTVRLAAPLQWLDIRTIMENCGWESFFSPYDKISGVTQKSSKGTTESQLTSTNTETTFAQRVTGSDDNNAFVLIEISFARPLYKACIPALITRSEMRDMLNEMELSKQKRICKGRNYQETHWKETVRKAANGLRSIPYHGLTTDICKLTQQFSNTKTRIELETSFWQEAAMYVNNNFVPSSFLHSNEEFEEMVLMTHTSLMRIVNETLIGSEVESTHDKTLRAARHARQLQDIPHAIELFLQVVAEHKRDANSWRELSTCLKDIDTDRANVCINKSINLNPRHPLSLLSKACMIFDENPDDAEPFFVALLAMYPFWVPLWVTASAYYHHRELYKMSENVMVCIKRSISNNMPDPMKYPRTWNYELGDWWDNTPLLPGTSFYYDAADLLLRLRGITLAEVCLARALSEAGETPMYYHLLALCCRLRGDLDNALCHLAHANEIYPKITYLKSLEGECRFKKNDLSTAMTCFEKSISCSGAYITLLSLSAFTKKSDPQKTPTTLMDLLRRQPSAYAWMSFADYWMTKTSVKDSGDMSKEGHQSTPIKYAIACAEEALKWDRRSGRAWAALSRLVKPSARRLFCRNMATMCGFRFLKEKLEYASESNQSICYRLGDAMYECHCDYITD